MVAENRRDLEVMTEIAAAVRGGDAALAAKPYFVLYLEPTSALSHPVDSVDKLLFCADHGIPAIYSPAPLAGGTAPITIAGQVAQGTAESLLGLVIHQLRKPGAPFLFGIGPAVLDMATSQSSYNAPEYLMGYVCAVELARWLDLPNWGYAGTTDAQVIDAQAGMETAELTLAQPDRRLQSEPRPRLPRLRHDRLAGAGGADGRVPGHEPQALRAASR